MVEIPILDWSGDAASAVIEESGRLGLTISSEGKLAAYPGSRHWHLKIGRRSGTLEVTVWPARNRLWVTYHANRVGDGWVQQLAPVFARALAERLGGHVEWRDAPVDVYEATGDSVTKGSG